MGISPQCCSRGGRSVRQRLGALARAALALLAVGAAPVFAQDRSVPHDEADRREVLALDGRRARAFVEGNADLLDRITAADYTHVETSGVARTKAEFMAERRGGAVRFRSFIIDRNDVRVFGDVAVVTGRYSNQVETAAGLQPVKQARHQRVYVRRDGEWIVVAHQATEVGEPTDGPVPR